MSADKFLITGTGRSGTLFVSTALTYGGVKTGHEDVYTSEGMSSWDEYEGDASWFATPLIKTGHASRPESLIHVTRHPSRVIASRYEVGLSPEIDHPILELWKPELCLPLDADETMDPVDRFNWACDLWCQLVDAAETISDATFQLEELHRYEVAMDLLDIIGHPGADPSPFWRVTDTVNHKEEWHRTRWHLPDYLPWCTLPSRVRSRAEALGYGEEM